MSSNRARSALFALLVLTLAAGPTAAAQAPGESPQRPRTQRGPAAVAPEGTPAPQADPRFARVDDENARETKQRFNNVLRQYPPSLAEVLRLDPSLLTNQAYLAPYPTLAAFLAQHPEVAHNPGYFIGEVRFNSWDSDPRRPVINLMENTLAGLAVLTGFLAFIGTVGFLLKYLIDYRRWLRVSKVQTEAHSKLLDRLTSNEDLLAYIQSSPGKRFLESAPIPIDAATRPPIAAPIGRILWSVQAGMVIAMGGLGLIFVSSQLSTSPSPGVSDVSLPLFAMGVVALALGLGFVLSAIVAYLISRRLGLFEPAPIVPHA